MSGARLDWTSPESVARWSRDFGIVDQARWEAAQAASAPDVFAELDAAQTALSERIEAGAAHEAEAWLYADDGASP